MRVPASNDREPGADKRAVVHLGRNQMCLLIGLCDRPNFTAESSKDLVLAAMPYRRMIGYTSGVQALEKSSRRLSSDWVERKRVGRCLTARLTPRGVAMVEQAIPVHIHGYGPYRGVAALRETHLHQRRRESVAFRWQLAHGDEDMIPVMKKADELVEQWCRRNPVHGMYANPMMRARRSLLEYYVRGFVLRFAALPSGKHRLVRKLHGSDFLFDFGEVDSKR
ncbi:MAG TPA: hypothetical protein VKZ41_04715 [Gemmatimonadales bacterium]|nr:hypothetical protein [Gemmatimonadales bacterium]